MKRILFLTKKVHANRLRRLGFIVRMFFKKTKVSYISVYKEDDLTLEKETLYITDDLNAFEKIESLGSEAIVLIDDEKMMEQFKSATYFIMDAEATEHVYYERLYKRINDEPWEMIKTRRLLLRETVESDVDDFVKMYENPEMTKYTEALYEDPEEERKYVAEYIEKVYKIQGFGIWTVVRRKDNKIIGRAGLTAREGFDNYEIGFAIGCDYQRKGYGYEAVKAILSFAKRNELGKINALVMPGNEASKRLLSKAGFLKVSDTTLGNEHYEVWQR
jgi:RimJ/RimL family protein N-acetyltransferase